MASNDKQKSIDTHALVVRHFNGDYDRAGRFIAERSNKPTGKFFSVNQGFINFKKD